MSLAFRIDPNMSARGLRRLGETVSLLDPSTKRLLFESLSEEEWLKLHNAMNHYLANKEEEEPDTTAEERAETLTIPAEKIADLKELLKVLPADMTRQQGVALINHIAVEKALIERGA